MPLTAVNLTDCCIKSIITCHITQVRFHYTLATYYQVGSLSVATHVGFIAQCVCVPWCFRLVEALLAQQKKLSPGQEVPCLSHPTTLATLLEAMDSEVVTSLPAEEHDLTQVTCQTFYSTSLSRTLDFCA